MFYVLKIHDYQLLVLQKYFFLEKDAFNSFALLSAQNFLFIPRTQAHTFVCKLLNFKVLLN